MVINVFCDGSIKGGNPGGHGVGGYVIKHINGKVVTGTVDLGKSPTMTNNVAEYSAVVAALEELVFQDHVGYSSTIAIHCDSKLVVWQCKDVWQCNNDRLMKMRDDIWMLCGLFACDITFTWIPREENTEADEVSRSLYED
tara:strand:+ start:82 stop:504 length:423 start_codon:yes stop_codon:yes gene_type:complete